MNEKQMQQTASPKTPREMPLVAIVGRPNVGKSTLFNRLIRRRLAITSPKSGTTRDGAAAPANFCGKDAMLVDTGGYRLSAECGTNEVLIDEQVRGRVADICKKADVILLLLEAGDAAAEDEEIILFLRPMMQKTIIAVNKTEGGRLESESYEWARFGFKQMLFISAEHGDRIEDLREAIASKLPETALPPAQENKIDCNKSDSGKSGGGEGINGGRGDDDNSKNDGGGGSNNIKSNSNGLDNNNGRDDSNGLDDSNIEGGNANALSLSRPLTSHADALPAIRLALLGKPNTGKSTLLNLLTHSELSIVSPIAGTTRDTVLGDFSFEGHNFTVLDTAGIRRKSRVTDDIEYYSVNRAIKSLDDCDIAIILIDSQEGISEQDKKICDRALNAGRAVIFALSKWDTQPAGRKAAKDACNEVRAAFPQMAYSPIVEISAIKGTGIISLLRTAVKTMEQLVKRVETSALNIALNDWTEHRPPPASKSGRFKARYMTQIAVNPPRFVLFARAAPAAPKTYLTYIKNCIRRDMGFDLIPVVLEVRESSKKK